MKVLLVNGSPHKTGGTYTALNTIANSLKEENIDSEIFWVGRKPISGCIACHGCRKLHKCVIGEEPNEFLNLAKEADAFVFGSPVHFGSMSGLLSSLLDRAFYVQEQGEYVNFRFKPCAVVVSGRRGGATATFDQLIKYPAIAHMPIISSGYWNMVHGNNAEEALKDDEGIQTMYRLGKNMAYYLKCIELAKQNDILPPVYTDKIYTNFIR